MEVIFLCTLLKVLPFQHEHLWKMTNIFREGKTYVCALQIHLNILLRTFHAGTEVFEAYMPIEAEIGENID